MLLSDHGLVTPTACVDQFFACWSECPAIVNWFIFLSNDPLPSDFGGVFVAENSDFFLPSSGRLPSA